MLPLCRYQIEFFSHGNISIHIYVHLTVAWTKANCSSKATFTTSSSQDFLLFFCLEHNVYVYFSHDVTVKFLFDSAVSIFPWRYPISIVIIFHTLVKSVIVQPRKF